MRMHLAGGERGACLVCTSARLEMRRGLGKMLLSQSCVMMAWTVSSARKTFALMVY